MDLIVIDQVKHKTGFFALIRYLAAAARPAVDCIIAKNVSLVNPFMACSFFWQLAFHVWSHTVILSKYARFSYSLKALENLQLCPSEKNLQSLYQVSPVAAHAVSCLLLHLSVA